MDIAIIGAGAMGCLFAARLHDAGAAVTLLDIDPLTLHHISLHGVRLHSAGSTGPVHSHHPVRALRAEQAAGPFELIVIFTKSFSTGAALASVSHLLGPDTWVLTLQNGLGHVDTIAAQVAASRILVGVTDIPADLTDVGTVHCTDAGGIRLWSHAGTHQPMLTLVTELFNRGGLPCIADPQVQVAIWHKAAFNAALNALCTVLREPVAGIGDNEDGRWLVRAVIEESAAVACAQGVAFDAAQVLQTIDQVYAEQGQHRPSMLQDRLAGRATEIENINGAIVHSARRQGVATPVLETLYRLVRIGEPA